MKVLVVLSCIVACALAEPGFLAAPAFAAQYAVPGPIISYSDLAAAPLTVSAVPAVAPVAAVAPVTVGLRSQYHAQDVLGQASYGHVEPFQAHSAVQDAFGNKIGSYSYVAPDGQIVKTHYVADAAGVRIASNALPVGPSEPVGPVPVAPEDTAEVVAARAAHLAEVETAKSRTKRGVPASTAPLALVAPVTHTATALTYAATPIIHAPRIADVVTPVSTAPVAVPAPVAYTAGVPLPYSAGLPLAYVAGSPVAYGAGAPLLRDATLTKVVNNPGHAISYRVD